jgi:hypothetical protein
MEQSLGIEPARLEQALQRLLKQKRVRRVRFWGKEFFEPPGA